MEGVLKCHVEAATRRGIALDYLKPCNAQMSITSQCPGH